MTKRRWTVWSVSNTKYDSDHTTYKDINIHDPKSGTVIASLSTYGDCNDHEWVIRQIKNYDLVEPGSTLVHADSCLGQTIRGRRW